MEEKLPINLYILLKVKSRIGLGVFEWVWLKLHKEPPRDDSDRMLDNLWLGKFIEEEPWENDEQGREIIPSLPNKRFVLTNLGKRKLRKEKWMYLWIRLGKVVWCLIWLTRKLWWLIAAAVVGELVRLLFPSLLQGV